MSRLSFRTPQVYVLDKQDIWKPLYQISFFISLHTLSVIIKFEIGQIENTRLCYGRDIKIRSVFVSYVCLTKRNFWILNEMHNVTIIETKQHFISYANYPEYLFANLVIEIMKIVDLCLQF